MSKDIQLKRPWNYLYNNECNFHIAREKKLEWCIEVFYCDRPYFDVVHDREKVVYQLKNGCCQIENDRNDSLSDLINLRYRIPKIQTYSFWPQQASHLICDVFFYFISNSKEDIIKSIKTFKLTTFHDNNVLINGDDIRIHKIGEREFLVESLKISYPAYIASQNYIVKYSIKHDTSLANLYRISYSCINIFNDDIRKKICFHKSWWGPEQNIRRHAYDTFIEKPIGKVSLTPYFVVISEDLRDD